MIGERHLKGGGRGLQYCFLLLLVEAAMRDQRGILFRLKSFTQSAMLVGGKTFIQSAVVGVSSGDLGLVLHISSGILGFIDYKLQPYGSGEDLIIRKKWED